MVVVVVVIGFGWASHLLTQFDARREELVRIDQLSDQPVLVRRLAVDPGRGQRQEPRTVWTYLIGGGKDKVGW